jgi:hypothetical protein
MLDIISRKLCALSHATQINPRRNNEAIAELFDGVKEQEVNI